MQHCSSACSIYIQNNNVTELCRIQNSLQKLTAIFHTSTWDSSRKHGMASTGTSSVCDVKTFVHFNNKVRNNNFRSTHCIWLPLQSSTRGRFTPWISWLHWAHTVKQHCEVTTRTHKVIYRILTMCASQCHAKSTVWMRTRSLANSCSRHKFAVIATYHAADLSIIQNIASRWSFLYTVHAGA